MTVDSLGIRALAEIMYTMCVKLYLKKREATGMTFKQILNKIIENLMERANQIDLIKQSSAFSHEENEQEKQLRRKDNHQMNIKRNSVEIVFKRHWFTKTKHCNFCIVCQKEERNTKSKYACMICSKKFNRNISLCIQRCDRLFHENPYLFVRNLLKIETKVQQKKKDIIMKNIKEISVSDYLRQIENYNKTYHILMKLVNPEKSITLDPIYFQSNPNHFYSGSKRSDYQKEFSEQKGGENLEQPEEQSKEMDLEYQGLGENLPFLNLNAADIEKINIILHPQTTLISKIDKSQTPNPPKRQRRLKI